MAARPSSPPHGADFCMTASRWPKLMQSHFYGEPPHTSPEMLLQSALFGEQFRRELIRVDIIGRNPGDVEVLRHEVHRALHLYRIDVADAFPLGRVGHDVPDGDAEVLLGLYGIDGWIFLQE